jgi:hypothetical protein
VGTRAGKGVVTQEEVPNRGLLRDCVVSVSFS